MRALQRTQHKIKQMQFERIIVRQTRTALKFVPKVVALRHMIRSIRSQWMDMVAQQLLCHWHYHLVHPLTADRPDHVARHRHVGHERLTQATYWMQCS